MRSPIRRPPTVALSTAPFSAPFPARLAALLALLLAVSLLLWPRPASAAEPSLLRVALIVQDAAASMRFYELLGYRVEMDQTNPRKPEGNFFPLNVPATQTRLVIMASAGGEGGRIGLVEFSAPSPADNRRDPERTGRGDPVLVFDVTDAEAIHARLRDAGVRILEPPQVYVSKKLAADGTPMRGRVFHVRDPDGYLVELLEAPKPAR
jgi:catechol 2,3-dioxygenase-like lactoylglutathione lyase family enzyme